MKIFISWSGERSKKVAVALRGWVKMVLQATEPWISTRDIDGGAGWFRKITEELKDSDTGIICLTPENIDEPWILFEAGAIAKGKETNRVCTLLIGLNATDIKGPLAEFHHTPCTKDGISTLLAGFNKTLKTPLGEKELDNLILRLWPDLSPVIEDALKTQAEEQAPKVRSQIDMLEEILERIRGVENRMTIESVPSSADAFWRDLGLKPFPMLISQITPSTIKALLPNATDRRRALEQFIATKDLENLKPLSDMSLEDLENIASAISDGHVKF